MTRTGKAPSAFRCGTLLPLGGAVRAGQHLAGDLPSDPAGVVGDPHLALSLLVESDNAVGLAAGWIPLRAAVDHDPAGRGPRRDHPAAELTDEHAREPDPPRGAAVPPGWLTARRIGNARSGRTGRTRPGARRVRVVSG